MHTKFPRRFPLHISSVLASLFVLGLLATFQQSCGVDYLYHRCKNTDECGQDTNKRDLTCACDGICRARCQKENDCLEDETCKVGFCIYQGETDAKLGESCSVQGQPESCQLGILECNENNKLKCKAISEVSPEVCDGKDNDCDGKVDNDLEQPCNNDCGPGMRLCIDGEWKPCNAANSRPCETSTGECKEGTEFCRNGKWQGVCEGASNPKDEKCDNKDNDCDGSVDEDFSKKGKSCQVGRGECTRIGNWQCNSNGSDVECSEKPGEPEIEECDGKDNDCNGAIDEGIKRNCKNDCGAGSQLCINGNWTKCDAVGARFCGKGIGDCKKGIELCRSGNWTGVCDEQKLGGVEKCDGRDNDCDGNVDEDWPDKNKVCEVGKGSCRNLGVWICKPDLSGVSCSAQPRQPSPETCDNQDNNCNGQIDENLKQKCSNVCGDGEQVCVGGNWTPCNAVGSRICGSTQGACTPGTETCKEGQWSACVGEVKGTPETCDLKDNDCDGSVDEDWSLLGGNCAAFAQGECKKEGKFVCKPDGTGIQCSALTPSPPKPEVCDGKDNDCNGIIDDVAPLTLSGNPAAVLEVSIAPNGQYLAGATGNEARIWEMTSQQTRFKRSLKHGTKVTTLMFLGTVILPKTPNYVPLLATGASDGKVRIWNPNNGTLVRTLSGHTSAITTVRFDPLGQLLASSSNDGSIRIWNPATGQLIRTLRGHQGAVTKIAFGLFGNVLGSIGADKTGKIWNINQGSSFLFAQGKTMTDITFGPNGNEFFVVESPGVIQEYRGIVINAGSFHFSRAQQINTFPGRAGIISSIHVEFTNRLLISGGNDRNLSLWDRIKGNVFNRFKGHSGAIRTVNSGPSPKHGLVLVSGGEDRTVRVWSCFNFPL